MKMQIRELITALIASILLGLVVCLALNGFPRFSKQQPFSTVGAPTQISEVTATAPLTTTLVNNPASSSLLNSNPTPTLVPVIAGKPKGADIEDVLLLYSSSHPSNFDINFCKLAEFYGLLSKRVDLDGTELTDGLLRDAQGGYYKLIGVSASTLQRSPHALNKNEIANLKAAIEAGGANLMVSNIDDKSVSPSLTELTAGALLGVTRPEDNHRDWIVSTAAPEITLEFTGQVITSTSSAPQADFALIFDPSVSITPLVLSNDESGMDYQIFSRLAVGVGSIFLDAGEQGQSLETIQLMDVYYGPSHFSQILPLMFTIRYAMSDKVWHSDHNYANLTIDDPSLIEPFYKLNYASLLQEMKAHNFHTTIALIPAHWEKSDEEVIKIFLNNPDRFSLVQHGNNHIGYEFYKYTVAPGDLYPADPLDTQEWNILEGLSRMEMLRETTGVSYGRVMIFPYGISPEATLVVLKKYNYLATVNAQDVPLDATRPSNWDYEMYPVIMNFGNFAALTRRHPGTYLPFQPNIQPFLFDLFIGKPALIYSHAYGTELFAGNIGEFDPVADQLNQLAGGMQWLSLGNIIKHIHLEKVNDDGSLDVRMFANDLILTNDSKEEQTYHIEKEETLNVPIASLTINTQEFPYRVEAGQLSLDLDIPAKTTEEIYINYEK
jgi:hypothetical protein